LELIDIQVVFLTTCLSTIDCYGSGKVHLPAN